MATIEQTVSANAYNGKITIAIFGARGSVKAVEFLSPDKALDLLTSLQAAIAETKIYLHRNGLLPEETDHIAVQQSHIKRLDNALSSIQGELDGVEWSNETLDFVADHLRAAGYPVRDIDDINAGGAKNEPHKS